MSTWNYLSMLSKLGIVDVWKSGENSPVTSQKYPNHQFHPVSSGLSKGQIPAFRPGQSGAFPVKDIQKCHLWCHPKLSSSWFKKCGMDFLDVWSDFHDPRWPPKPSAFKFRSNLSAGFRQPTPQSTVPMPKAKVPGPHPNVKASRSSARFETGEFLVRGAEKIGHMVKNMHNYCNHIAIMRFI